MKLKDVFLKFFSPSTQEKKWVSLEHILVFHLEILDSKDNKMTRIDDDLYLFIKESRQYVKMVSEEKYWEMYKLSVDCS